MPSTLPVGEPVPADGALPQSALKGTGDLGLYLHVPFCSTRCGYCDFNTYTAEELGTGVSRASYLETATRELALMQSVLGNSLRPVTTIFVGGGTPTLLPPAQFATFLDLVRDEVGIAPGAEISIESNPESVDAIDLEKLRAAGFTRVSFGMQSSNSAVLKTLDRKHTPGRVVHAVAEARAAGFEHINVDLIYGAPAESDQQWQESLEAAVALEPDHISAYALIVEDGTKLGAQVGRGEVQVADDDALATRYLMAEEILSANGMQWYEVSNWEKPGGACAHNLAYWKSQDWWGIGPGAHSHVAGVRWWNVKHPVAYAQALEQGQSPAAAREILTSDQIYDEQILLGLRLRQGLSVSELTPAGLARGSDAVVEGLLEPADFEHGRAVLTLRGRLLADRLAVELLSL
ncbi:MAG: radical SAM family heme chaperone HemW [Actinomycetes bacterium]